MSEITKENIKSFLGKLGFSLKDGEELTYSKIYKNQSDYEIKIIIDKINFKKSKIHYGDKIKRDRDTLLIFIKKKIL